MRVELKFSCVGNLVARPSFGPPAVVGGAIAGGGVAGGIGFDREWGC